MLVRSLIRGNAAGAESRGLSQVKKRYVTSARESNASALRYRVNGFQGAAALKGALAALDRS
jgi:hypothetical protein